MRVVWDSVERGDSPLGDRSKIGSELCFQKLKLIFLMIPAGKVCGDRFLDPRSPTDRSGSSRCAMSVLLRQVCFELCEESLDPNFVCISNKIHDPEMVGFRCGMIHNKSKTTSGHRFEIDEHFLGDNVDG